MKKLLFLLLLSVSIYGQTYQNPTFGTVTTKTSPTVTNDPYLTTTGTTGVQGKIAPVNVLIPYTPINYTISGQTIGQQIAAIDAKIGTMGTTSAGVTQRVYFTADNTVVNAVTYFASSLSGKGSTASGSPPALVLADNTKAYFTKDVISIAQPAPTIGYAGTYSGNLTVSASPTPVATQQRFTVEIYRTDNLGVPIASGVSGAPVGDLGVTVLAILDSGIINLTAGSITNIAVSGVLTQNITLNTGERLRYHVSAAKIGAGGGNVTFGVYYGTSYNSYYDVPVAITTDAVLNKSAVSGVTDTDALNTLNGGLIYKRTIAQIRALTGTLPSNNFYTTDVNQEGNWYYDASDVSSSDNTGTVLVTADGKRIKRIYSGDLNANWFGAKGDNSTNNNTVFTQLSALNVKIFVPEGNYITTLTPSTNWSNFYGNGILKINSVDYNLTYLTNPKKRIGELTGRMSAGETIKIACFGDSTTDGNNTTGWTANTGGDHNPTAPNSWPVKLQAILRDMYGNNNISVYNAGYSGQRLDNGWAYENYEPAVVKNASYGIVDITFIAFGLNDISIAGSQIANTRAETEKLIKKVLAYGGLPILLTCDAFWRSSSTGDIRDNVEASREINAIKFDLAKQFNIPIYDVEFALSEWFEKNNDPYKWYNTQNDALHVNDFGHAFKAGFMAKELFRDIVNVKNEPVRISPFDSKAKYYGGQSFVYNNSNVRNGANVILGSGAYTASTPMQTLWVWNEAPDCTVIYNSSDNDGPATRANSPKITVKEFIENTDLYNDKIPTSGDQSAPIIFRSSDRENIITQLYYGLNKVQYISPATNSNTLFYGDFSFKPNFLAGVKRANKVVLSNSVNALKNTGPLYYKAPASSGITYNLCEPYLDGSNLVSYGQDGKTTTVFVDADLGVGSGLILLGGKGFLSTPPPPPSTANQLKNSSLLIYRLANEIKIYQLSITNSNVVTYNQLGVVSTTWSGSKKFRLEFKRNGSGNQQINFLDGWIGTTSLILFENLPLTSTPFAFSGSVGGVFCNTVDDASGPLIYVKEMFIKYE